MKCAGYRQTDAAPLARPFRLQSQERPIPQRRTADNSTRTEVTKLQIQKHPDEVGALPEILSLMESKRHNGAIQEQMQEYKSNLVDDLNNQITVADDEMNGSMDRLSECFEQRLRIIQKAGEQFVDSVADDKLEIDQGNDVKRKVRLGQVMTDLQQLVEAKAARLEELAREHLRARQQILSLSIAILGEDGVSINVPLVDDNQQTMQLHAALGKKDIGLFNLAGGGQQGNEFKQVYEDAKKGLEHLEIKLDLLVSKNLEDNKGALKTYQTGRASRQKELSKLINSWSVS